MARKPKAKPNAVEPPLPVCTKSTAVVDKAAKPEMKVVTVMDSITVTINVSSAMVSELISKVGPKLDIPDKKSITSIITAIISNSLK